MPSIKQADYVENAEFFVDGVLFDMDGTLVSSIGAVEVAWGNVAEELNKDRQEVIDATHGRRAIDNLRELDPKLKDLGDAEMDPHVAAFEEKILKEADAFNKEVRSRRESVASSRSASRAASRRGSTVASPAAGSPHDSQDSSRRPSRSNSMSAGAKANSRKGSFAAELTKRMAGMQLTSMAAKPTATLHSPSVASPGTISPAPERATKSPQVFEDSPFDDDFDEELDIDSIEVDTSDLTDNSVVILPGVKRMIDSIPDGRWCVCTSGASTYCYGALERVGIELPKVVITADHKELKRGKPHPDPFILAAKKLGFDPKKCLVVEDSPSGIRAGVAAGSTVIAVATSHPVEKIRDCGQTYLVPTLNCVTVYPQPDGRLKITIHPAVTEDEAIKAAEARAN